MASAIFKNLTNPAPLENAETERRNAVGELETESKVGVIRTGTSVRRFQANQTNGLSLLPAGHSDRNFKPVAVLADENDFGHPSAAHNPLQSIVVHSKTALPIQSVMKAENTVKPAKWNDPAGVHEIVPAVPAQPSFQVFSRNFQSFYSVNFVSMDLID